MKKQIFFWLLILFCCSICVSQEITPQVFLDRDFEVYLGLNVDELKSFFPESFSETEIIFTVEKPEYNTIIWDSKSGLEIYFYKGFREIKTIILSSDKHYLYYKGSKVIPFVTKLEDVINLFGDGMELYNESRKKKVYEYNFKKKEYNPLSNDIIQIDVNDENIIEYIVIFDSSKFL